MECYQIDAPKQAGGADSFELQPARSSSLAIEKGFIVSKPGSRVTEPSTATLRAATDVVRDRGLERDGETAATPSRAGSVVERLLPAHPVTQVIILHRDEARAVLGSAPDRRASVTFRSPPATSLRH